jgi:hypothetical protein
MWTKTLLSRAFFGCTLLILMSSTVLAEPQLPEKKAKAVVPNLWPKASYTDIKQGNAGTCWILASIAALEHNGAHLENRITPLGKNYYSVKLFNFKDPAHRPAGGMKVDVEKVFFDGTTTPADAQYDPKDPRSGWVVIMQRAFVQAVAHWDPSQSVTNPHSGGANDALGILTGKSVKLVSAQDAKVQKTVLAALAAQKTIAMGTNGNAKTLVGNHVYAVIGSAKQGLVLYNPYGFSATVSWSVLAKDGGTFFIN